VTQNNSQRWQFQSVEMEKEMDLNKKRVLGLAAVALALPLGAQAQSSVTIYGQIDLALAKYDAQKIKREATGSTSRLGLRGVEDLGDGLKALFQLEHQINPDDGTQYNANAFWSGRSTVGLEGGFGRVLLGRDVNPSHYVEVAADPFGQDGMAGGYGTRGGISQANGGPGQIDTVRTNNSINYTLSLSGFTFRAQTAAREGADSSGNKPFSASLIYASGPWQLGVSHINPAKANDHWSYLSGVYKFSAVRASAGVGSGRNTFNQAMRNVMLGANVPLGVAELKATFSRTTAEGTTIQAKTSLGYYYALSKRTTVYTDVVHDPKAGGFVYGAAGWAATGTTLGKVGYDVGLKHVF
jgi:predicted porin